MARIAQKGAKIEAFRGKMVTFWGILGFHVFPVAQISPRGFSLQSYFLGVSGPDLTRTRSGRPPSYYCFQGVTRFLALLQRRPGNFYPEPENLLNAP